MGGNSSFQPEISAQAGVVIFVILKLASSPVDFIRRMGVHIKV